MQKKGAFHQRLEVAAASSSARAREEHQALRLLYVGWTRARDRVVLAGRAARPEKGERTEPATRTQGLLAQLQNAAGPLLRDSEDRLEYGGRDLGARLRVAAPSEAVRCAPTAGEAYDASGPVTYAAASIVASSLDVPGLAEPAESIGSRTILGGDPAMERVGEAIHRFLAADRPHLRIDERRLIAAGLLDRWAVAYALTPDDLVQAGDALCRWADARWPGARWHREWPLLHRQESGTIMRGAADLVLESADSCVIIDHKSFPGTVAQAVERAAAFGGQLGAYAAAVAAATGKPVAGCFIHLPVCGVVVPVRPDNFCAPAAAHPGV
jgi:hypothetical protein